MKDLRFIHTADWHSDSDPKKQNKLEASLKQLVEYCKEVKVNAIVHAGDIWDKKQSYAQSSGVPVVIDYLRQLSKLVDFIFITKGNNSHDEPGSVSLLHQLEPNIYAYEYPVVLAVYQLQTMDKPMVTDILRTEAVANYDYIVSLVPYPTKAMFITDQSIDLNNAEFIEMFEQTFDLISDVTQPYTCPKVLAFHGNVVGSRLSTGQTLVSQDIMVAPRTLEAAQADYYALGHIHLRQEIKPNMVYSGSIYNKNWGETEQKSFEVVEFTEIHPGEGDTVREEWRLVGEYFYMDTQRIMLSAAKPMIKLSCTFQDGEIEYQSEEFLVQEALDGAEVRLRITVAENERKLITEDEISKIKSLYGPDTKIEFNIIPDQRESRSEQIMHCKTLLDEVKEYAAVVEQPINGTIEQKVLELQGKGVLV